jgi:ketol-acid reductoisomerase
MAPLKVYHTADCDRTLILNRQITVVGYGSQGRAFALNLSDSGCNVQVALRDDSPSRQRVYADKLPLRSFGSVGKSDIIVFAFPDHEQPEFYRSYLLDTGGQIKTIVFLHGLNVHFGNITFNSRHDVLLLAPHGPGADLRDRYLSGEGLSCFLAVGQDASGNAHATALALAAAIGADKAGIYETTFKDETLGDLFGEQTLLVGGLAGLTLSVFRTMVEHGLPPENAYLETVKQLKLLANMVEQHGPAGMVSRVSKTAAYGSLTAMPKLFDERFRTRLEELFHAIESGEFNRQLRTEATEGFPALNGLMRTLKGSICQQTSEHFKPTGSEQ